jgi:hypothetical protein
MRGEWSDIVSSDPDPTLAEWWALEMAFCHVVSGHHSFLDRRTGQLIAIRTEVPGDGEKLQQLADAGDRYLRVEPVSSREQHRWMKQFVGTIPDRALRERLGEVILRPGAFRAFKEVLQEHADERTRWFAFRRALLRIHIELWFRERDLSPAGVAPADVWATADLRERARALVERLPPTELPSAIAYLMHLGVRRAADAPQVIVPGGDDPSGPRTHCPANPR